MGHRGGGGGGAGAGLTRRQHGADVRDYARAGLRRVPGPLDGNTRGRAHRRLSDRDIPRGWDDFKGADLKGKVALLLVNDPDFEAAAGEPVAGKFGGKTMTYYGRWTYKFEEAARRGAIGAIIVHETEGAGYGWNVVESAAGENFNIVLPRGARQPVLLQGWMQQPAAEAMLKRAGYDYAVLKRQARTAGSHLPLEDGIAIARAFVLRLGRGLLPPALQQHRLPLAPRQNDVEVLARGALNPVPAIAGVFFLVHDDRADGH